MEANSTTVRTVLLTAVAPVAWGSTYAVTQLSLPPGRPLFSAAMRILPAGLLMLLWLRELPCGRWWGRSLVLGTLNHAVFFGLLYVAAYRLPSGLGATLTAVSPLVVMAVARMALGERQPLVTVLAAVVGIGGVVLLVWQNDRSGPVDPVGVAASVGAVVSASVGFVLVKRWTEPGRVLVTTAWQLVVGGVLLVPVAAVAEGGPPALDLPAVLALAYLGLVGSVVGYVVWFRGLTRMDAGAVAVVGLLNPVVGTVLGVVLLGETFGPVHLVAMMLVLGSVLAAQAPVRGAVLGRLRPPTVRTSAPDEIPRHAEVAPPPSARLATSTAAARRG
ncbi:DMT family transporter [Phycicoccus sonneratiae]|uniref:EamA family transporter n=1 Tax=Phycicoccus sonneratiae TaxID=2807628 RepID=A0ABS2CMD6_9MICO|nr:EamA family transporter [Phycicoccus sonneraticus]MBM6401042.1 EamA family transporter [Phycicoccus sonneraticus]